jgi:hypothetical protein
MRQAVYLPCVGETANEYNVIAGTSKRNSPIEKPKRKWDDNKMDPKIYDDVEWIYLALSSDQ